MGRLALGALVNSPFSLNTKRAQHDLEKNIAKRMGMVGVAWWVRRTTFALRMP
jgi:hypothetical protein